jgi:hypothetical protein
MLLRGCPHSDTKQPNASGNVATPVDREYLSIEAFGRKFRHRAPPCRGSDSGSLFASRMPS